MSKHTPGRWKLDSRLTEPDQYGDGDSIAIFPEQGRVCICEVVAREGEGRRSTRIQEQAEANAALIAAAPELLEAVQMCLFAVTRDADANDGRVDRAAVTMLCEQIIAKATGE
jgi:hypothetical protein